MSKGESLTGPISVVRTIDEEHEFTAEEWERLMNTRWPLPSIAETIARLDRVIANVRHYQ